MSDRNTSEYSGYIHRCFVFVKRLGQRIRSFSIEARVNDAWVEIARGTTIGYKRIIRFEKPDETRQIRINILDSMACPAVTNVGTY